MPGRRPLVSNSTGNYTLSSSGDWTPTSGSGWTSGSGFTSSAYTGNGTYWYNVAGSSIAEGLVSGTFTE